MTTFEEISKQIDDTVKENKVLHITVKEHNIRSQIHQYVKDKYRTTYISRSEYMAHGAEYNCCGVWHKSSEYGNSWNGGYIFCEYCGEYESMTYDDYEDLADEEDIRLSLYKPTGSIMICRKGHPYKKWYRCPFSYRKHY